MLRNFYSLVFAFLCAVAVYGPLTPAAQAAVILNISNGQLIGAQNVNVRGTLYDVSFADGTCVELYSGCDDPLTDFTFSDFDSAFDAGVALLEQVFLDTVDGMFDSRPELTRGCENPVTCFAVIPFARSGFDYLAQVAENLNIIGPERVFDSFSSINFDLNRLSNNTFAVFSPASSSPTEISEPSTMLLFGTAILGLGVVLRRRQRDTAL